MASLRTFIAERRAQILREMAVLHVELEDLDRAEAALSDTPQVSPSRSTPTTLKGMAIELLRAHSRDGLAASQILEGIERKFDVKIERSSLSPQLSRLKKEGILTQEGKNWRRVGALEKEAAYLGSPNENGSSGLPPDDPEARSTDGSRPSEEHVNQSDRDIFS